MENKQVPNYIKQILAAYETEPSIRTPGVKTVNIYHDDDCGIFTTGECTCKPDIEVITKAN